MGVTSAFSGVASTYIRYSSFLGMMYVSNENSEAAIKEAKAVAGGDAVVKNGFKGYTGNTPSGQARDHLRTKGFEPVKLVDVRLTSVKLSEVDVEGNKEPYVSVGFSDEEGKYVVSLSLSHPAAQWLVRKLANAKPGALSELNMYGIMEQSESDGNMYANHKVFLMQDGKQILGIDAKSTVKLAVDAAVQALIDAGVDDKKTLRARKDSVSLKYHVDLLKQIEAKFGDAAPHETVEAPVPLADDDFSDDIPF